MLNFLKKYKKPISKNISIEEVEKLIEDAMFWNMVKKVAENKDCVEEQMEDTGYITVLEPCLNYDCPCSENREDCCNKSVEIDDKKYCKIFININKLCGLPQPKTNLDLNKILTEEECKFIADKITEFIVRKNFFNY